MASSLIIVLRIIENNAQSHINISIERNKLRLRKRLFQADFEADLKNELKGKSVPVTNIINQYQRLKKGQYKKITILRRKTQQVKASNGQHLLH